MFLSTWAVGITCLFRMGRKTGKRTYRELMFYFNFKFFIHFPRYLWGVGSWGIPDPGLITSALKAWYSKGAITRLQPFFLALNCDPHSSKAAGASFFLEYLPFHVYMSEFFETHLKCQEAFSNSIKDRVYSTLQHFTCDLSVCFFVYFPLIG